MIINLGILGCGIMVSYVSHKSMDDIEVLSDKLVAVYKEVKLYNTYSGELCKKTYDIF